MLDALGSELEEIGIDVEKLFAGVGEEARKRLDKSIRAGERVAAGKMDAHQLQDAAAVGA